MNNTDNMLEDIKNEIRDEGVFSEDQISRLEDMIERLEWYIDAKIENFRQSNL